MSVEEKLELGWSGKEKAEVEVAGDFILTAIIDSAFYAIDPFVSVWFYSFYSSPTISWLLSITILSSSSSIIGS